MPKDDRVYLGHMLDAARELVELSRGRSRRDLDTDRSYELSMERLLEIIGEAAANVSEDFRAGRPEVPWRDIVSMRNRLIHAYRRVDLDIVWRTVSTAVPRLIGQLEAILEE